MTAQISRFRNTLTGKISEMSEDAASVFPEYLEKVGPHAKPFEPGMFKPGKVGEFKNPEPETDAELQAQAELEGVLDEKAPNSRDAREAKARLREAEEQAEAERRRTETTSNTNKEGNGS